MTENKMVQADASAPALSEKVNGAGEMRRWPDYIYDPDDWEYTCNWDDVTYLTEDADIFIGDIREFATLTEGPRIYATLVPLSFDENGDADETEIQWFWTREEAQAATNRQPACAELNFSNDAERDGVSLNQSLHHTQSKEG